MIKLLMVFLIKDINSYKKFDALIITDIYNTKSRFQFLSKVISSKKIIIPDFLNFKNTGDG